MANKKIIMQPGVNTQATPLLNEGGYSLSNLVRHKDNLIEKYGGWQKLFQDICGGLVRAMHAYEDLGLNLNLGLGTDGGAQIYVVTPSDPIGSLYNISLTRRSSNLTPPFFSTSNGSPTVTVTDTAHGASAGDTIQIPMTIAGSLNSANTLVILPGNFTVTNVIDADTYTFDYTSAAVAGNPSGGYPPRFFSNYVGQTNPNYVLVGLANHGYVAGDTFGIQYEVPFPANGVTVEPGHYTVKNVITPVTFEIDVGFPFSTNENAFENNNQGIINYFANPPGTPQNWFIDNLGNNMLISFTNNKIYAFTPPVPPTGFATATVVPTAPQINSAMFTAMPQAQVISLGSEAVIGGGVQDPLLIRFSDAGSYSDWVASSTNQAGSYRLSRGSRIIGGIQAPQSTLVWTDTDIWSMAYIGSPLIYSFTIIGSGCGLISPQAKAVIGRDTHWMGTDSFWKFGDAGVQPVQCDVWDVVFNDIDRANQRKCFAGATSSFHEVAYYYPSVSGGTGEVDSYVRINVMNGKWDYGKLDRTAWLDVNVFGPPLGADLTKHIQAHEQGYDDDGAPMLGVFVQTGYFELADGSDFLFLDRIYPDFKWLGTNGYLDVTIFATNYPGQQPTIIGPFTVTPTTRQIPLGVRKRFLALRIEWGASLGFNARVGAPTMRVAPAGKAP